MLSTRAARSLASCLKGQGRYYSAVQPAESVIPQFEVPQLAKEPPKVTTRDDGLTIAAIENASPISRVGMAVQAGARFENAGYNGITHFLRNALAVTTASAHSVSIVRELQKYGCNFSCTSNREYLFYQVEGTRDNIEVGIDIMTSVLTEPLYYKHEIAKVAELVELDNRSLQPEALLMEDLHATAFKGGMANSIFCPSYQVKEITSDMMHAYRLSLFREARMAFVGVGVKSDFMTEKAKEFPASLDLVGVAQEIPTKYVGGENREPTGGNLAYAYLVTEGPSMNSKDAASAAVLQFVMGAGPSVKYSPGIVSRLGKAVYSALGSEDFAVSAINLPYSDTGLFGFSVTGNAQDMGTIMKAAAGEFAAVTKNDAISDQAVTIAKNQLKSAIMINCDDSSSVFNNMAVECLVTKKVSDAAALLQIVDSVSTADVANAAKKIINGKPTLVSRGNLTWMPRLVDLM
ncbi:cytochrome b-c1 complex subunit 2, mitochondrial-like isoform X2 [Pecten maximus]|uniref:cytochrome b-c1 complex subunit 2, mitochondrial-like isoform X2 n=1 Tax=Pecten maximus TaxID=6579 RepID=UPI0014587FBE|nr:cytochrome b-c1 complex subunit 2, mitochondrial-like isoform X2 [Pecten maximus]